MWFVQGLLALGAWFLPLEGSGENAMLALLGRCVLAAIVIFLLAALALLLGVASLRIGDPPRIAVKTFLLTNALSGLAAAALLTYVACQ